jgi:hypothetical protein
MGLLAAANFTAFLYHIDNNNCNSVFAVTRKKAGKKPTAFFSHYMKYDFHLLHRICFGRFYILIQGFSMSGSRKD